MASETSTTRTVWQRVTEAVKALASGETLSALLSRFSTPPERRVAFTIAVIALGAKMAKADGQVTRDEVAAFRAVFTIPANAERSAASLFNYARQDVAGFESYAAQVASMFGEGSEVLSNLMHGLFHIAMADGAYHPHEDVYLRRCAEIFGLSEADFQRLLAHYVPDRMACWRVLGLEPGASEGEIRARWRQLVRETHPDRLIAQGLPEEAIRLATARLARVNLAYETVMGERA
jgi:DnaJ like chaperone protein